jgi:hypothetical protein
MKMSSVLREIIDLHQFFQAWFVGDLSREDASFEYLESALADDFTLVRPNGTEVDRSTILTAAREAWGSRAGLHISIEAVEVIAAEATLIVARYDESEQEHGEKISRRVSTVVFRRSEHHPNGLAWLRVHETRAADACV